MPDPTVSALPEWATELHTWERRAAVRFRCPWPTWCYPPRKGGEACLPAGVQDISRDGISLVLHRPIEPETLINVELQGEMLKLPRVLLARVTHVTPRHSGHWLVGCEFVLGLTDDELRGLL